jgi:oxygen-independent coproporphyrinogen-3 oxidase
MSGIYLHIPFCKKACHYCNFHFSTNTQNADQMVDTLKREIYLRKKAWSHPIETIYFGGGTPSVLYASQIQALINEIFQNFDVIGKPEITIETNPDDLSESYLKELKLIGINRLSVGVQSFQDKELKLMNRAHSGKQALQSVLWAQDYFENISIDLLYGTPHTSFMDWEKNLKTALSLDVAHISSYALTLEPKTALDHFVNKGVVSLLHENDVEKQFLYLVEELTNVGYDHYELSSFGKPGFWSKNNTAYWQGKPYIGIGPSAHGFDGKQRYWNINNNSTYIRKIEQNEIPQTIENLSIIDRYNESIMIGLRASWGVSLTDLENNLGIHYRNHLQDQADRFIKEGLLFIKNNALKTTLKGAFLADGIAADLFLIDFSEIKK